jgi:glycosyltransferase involved in cell wall biosynthesis
MRVAVVTSHPIQYQAPWFRALSAHVDLHVLFAHRQTASQQAAAGYGRSFDWDIDLLSGYSHAFLNNVATDPNVYAYTGCDTPDVHAELEAGRFDAVIVTGWYLKCFWQAMVAARQLRIPMLVRGDSQLVTPHSELKRAAKELFHRWLISQFDGLLYVGQRNLEYLQHYGARADQCFHVPHFIDAERFGQAAAVARAQRNAVRERLGLPRDAAVVLYVGRFVEFKRPLDVLRAAARCTGLQRPLCVAYAGSGALISQLRAAGRELGVDTWFLGFRNQTELPEVYAAADVLVLPSDANETWGLVVNEAMACGTPAIVSNAVGCSADMVGEGRTGACFALGDMDALAGALTRVLSTFPNAQTQQALVDTTRAYSLEHAVTGTLNALRACTGQP